MTKYSPQDIDETVHIILMEDKETSMVEAWGQIKLIHPGIELDSFIAVWHQYRPIDRTLPGKDV